MMDEEATRELVQLRSVLKHHPALFQSFYKEEAVHALGKTVLLSRVPADALAELVEVAQRVEYPRGTLIAREGVFEEDDVIIVAHGEIRRWEGPEGRTHAVDTFDAKSLGTLELFHRHAARYSAECTTDVVAYRIPRVHVDAMVLKHPEVAQAVIEALTKYIRAKCYETSTPLFAQRQDTHTSIVATSLGASVESFYRAAMNTLINERLTGIRGPMFPNMHVQIPTRIVYINGLKQVRLFVQENFGHYSDAPAYRALCAFVPGVVMTPFASVLEASCATQNPEALWRKCFRGLAPRVSREIVFGLGINQLSEYYTEHTAWIPSAPVRQAAGSIAAGVTAGFLSHMPHSLGSLKMNQPNVSYGAHWEHLYSRYSSYVPAGVTNATHRRWMAQVMCVLFPIGVVRRSVLIAGTFTIINGTTYAFRNQQWP